MVGYGGVGYKVSDEEKRYQERRKRRAQDTEAEIRAALAQVHEKTAVGR